MCIHYTSVCVDLFRFGVTSSKMDMEKMKEVCCQAATSLSSHYSPSSLLPLFSPSFLLPPPSSLPPSSLFSLSLLPHSSSLLPSSLFSLIPPPSSLLPSSPLIVSQFMNKKIDVWGADTFHLSTISGGNPLVTAAYTIFKKRKLFASYKISPPVLVNFMMSIQVKCLRVLAILQCDFDLSCFSSFPSPSFPLPLSPLPLRIVIIPTPTITRSMQLMSSLQQTFC